MVVAVSEEPGPSLAEDLEQPARHVSWINAKITRGDCDKRIQIVIVRAGNAMVFDRG